MPTPPDTGESKPYPCPRCKKPYSFMNPAEWHVDPAVCKSCRTELQALCSKQHVIFFVGPDMCGKTEIAKATASTLGVPYFKASSEHESFLSSRVSRREAFLNQLRYADPRVFDVLKQSGYGLVLDRGFPCEYVYSAVLGRETDLTMLRHMDEMWGSLGAHVVLCHRRKGYAGIVDDLDSSLDEHMLVELEKGYREFASWTKCRLLELPVDDEDLAREVHDILTYLQESR
jgi:hypothetical protein